MIANIDRKTVLPRQSMGITLIELLVVIGIIGLLAAIGYPTYQNYVTETRRADAKGDLLQLSQFMERYFTENGRYDQDSGGTAVSLPFTTSPPDGSTTFYNLGFAAGEPTDTTFVLQATPQGAQATNDTQCGTISIDSTGTKCILGGTKCSDSATASTRQDVEECW